MLDKERTPTLKKIKEELQCLFGYHKHCARHYETEGSTQYIYCEASKKLIKKTHREDSRLKLLFSKNS